MRIKVKRAYEEASSSDGFRILVDRIWPRGIKKSDAQIDLWLKDIAPSKELRQWFGHDPKKWNEFKNRYKKELVGKSDLIKLIKKEAKSNTVTLVFGAKDVEHNNAVVLKEFMDR